MNRKHTRDDYLRLVDRIRAARPDILLTSDFIVGFPGETDQDHAATLRLIEQVGFGLAQLRHRHLGHRHGTDLAQPREELGAPGAGERAEHRLPRRVAGAEVEESGAVGPGPTGAVGPGATGAVGRLVAQDLAERGVAQRLLVRDPARPARPGSRSTAVQRAPGAARHHSSATEPLPAPRSHR